MRCMSGPDHSHWSRFCVRAGELRATCYTAGVKRQLALLSGFVALVTVPGATLAGLYSPPPGDIAPAWSPDGTRVAFVTGRESPSLAVVSTSGSPEARLIDLSRTPYYDPRAVALSPDWSFAAVERWSGETLVIAVVPLEGPEGQPVLVRAGSSPAWSPDSGRLGGCLDACGPDPPLALRAGAEGDLGRELVQVERCERRGEVAGEALG